MKKKNPKTDKFSYSKFKGKKKKTLDQKLSQDTIANETSATTSKDSLCHSDIPVSLTSKSIDGPTTVSAKTSPKIKILSHNESEEKNQALFMGENETKNEEWKFRSPPRGVSGNEFLLCHSVAEKCACRLSENCIQAHSLEELDEWKERFKLTTLKLEKEKEEKLAQQSYADRLIEKLSKAQNIDAILTEKIAGISYSISSKPSVSFSQKPNKHSWTLNFHSPFYVNVISLLYESHRSHFCISKVTSIGGNKQPCQSYDIHDGQEWFNVDVEKFKDSENSGINYNIEITFTTNIYGTFRQAVVVDFGFEPIFIQKFFVDIIPLDEFKELESAKTTIITDCERWCLENTDVVYFGEPSSQVEHSKWLETKYPPPTNENITVSQISLEKYSTKESYRLRIHDLLNYEEMAQFNLISSFNVSSFLHLSESYSVMPSSGAVNHYARSGELYAKLDLSSNISEDSPPGRLILNNCQSVLLSKDESCKAGKRFRAYEALIEAKTKKEIYLRISKEMVSDLNLQSECECALQIQFQLNRVSFCEMHYAVDLISSLDIIFPNTMHPPTIPWSPSIQWAELDSYKLNIKQKEALVAATCDSDVVLPPVLVIGPFGTGKTYTLCQALYQTIQKKNSRILICTHSNSAADIYINEFLHPLIESGKLEERPLRIYYHKRRVVTVHTNVQLYCCMEYINGERIFAVPTLEQINSHRIIITTINTSMILCHLGIPKGFFTNIFIDEAAQIIESATLIPLSLADSSTRIVLAGDYMQLSAEVFSPFCKERNLQMSLLERLYDYYPSDFPCKIMLIENYRSHPSIIKFTSTFFYEGKLKSRGKISAHPNFHALTFFTARGEDVQDMSSTAYYNNSEVLEIVERVTEICHSWPTSLWGPLQQESIGVVAPYLDQIMRIRAELRKKKLYRISVERVLNVQGKEFRVIFLSTVRTRHTCSDQDASLDYGFLSNEKLLTTAITRAQSLVAVVGDPVSLCSVGKCRRIWEEYIRECSDSNSLFGLTWNGLCQQLEGIELRKLYGLNPLAKEFIPSYLILSPMPPPFFLPPNGASFPYFNQPQLGFPPQLMPKNFTQNFSAPKNQNFNSYNAVNYNQPIVYQARPTLVPLATPFGPPLINPQLGIPNSKFNPQLGLPSGNFGSNLNLLPRIPPPIFSQPPPGYLPRRSAKNLDPRAGQNIIFDPSNLNVTNSFNIPVPNVNNLHINHVNNQVITRISVNNQVNALINNSVNINPFNSLHNNQFNKKSSLVQNISNKEQFNQTNIHRNSESPQEKNANVKFRNNVHFPQDNLDLSQTDLQNSNKLSSDLQNFNQLQVGLPNSNQAQNRLQNFNQLQQIASQDSNQLQQSFQNFEPLEQRLPNLNLFQSELQSSVNQSQPMSQNINQLEHRLQNYNQTQIDLQNLKQTQLGLQNLNHLAGMQDAAQIHPGMHNLDQLESRFLNFDQSQNSCSSRSEVKSPTQKCEPDYCAENFVLEEISKLLNENSPKKSVKSQHSNSKNQLSSHSKPFINSSSYQEFPALGNVMKNLGIPENHEIPGSNNIVNSIRNIGLDSSNQILNQAGQSVQMSKIPSDQKQENSISALQTNSVVNPINPSSGLSYRNVLLNQRIDTAAKMDQGAATLQANENLSLQQINSSNFGSQRNQENVKFGLQQNENQSRTFDLHQNQENSRYFVSSSSEINASFGNLHLPKNPPINQNPAYPVQNASNINQYVNQNLDSFGYINNGRASNSPLSNLYNPTSEPNMLAMNSFMRSSMGKSGSGRGRNVPLYLRKSSANNQNNLDGKERLGNLSKSSSDGWNLETIDNNWNSSTSK